MLIKICAWCVCTIMKDNSRGHKVTEMFKQFIEEQGSTITHGCCKDCLDEMDVEQPVHWNVPTPIISSMTSDHPSGLYYTGDYDKDVCSACGEMFCEGDCPQMTVDPDSPEYCPPCKGKHSKEKHMAQFCFIDDPTGHQVPCEHTRKTGSLLERLTRMKVIWDNNTKFDLTGLDS